MLSKITEITGKRQSGKTTQLIHEYLEINDHYASLVDGDKRHNFGEHTDIALLVICGPKPLFTLALKNIAEVSNINVDDICFKDFQIAHALDLNHLKSIITSHVKEHNTDVFIDDVDIYIDKDKVHNELRKFVLSIINDGTSYMCDITYTILDE